MLDNVSEVLFLVCFVIGVVIRTVWVLRARRLKGEEHGASYTYGRIGVAERLVLFLVFLGMQVIPAIYLFAPWLDFADYHLPAWGGGLGVAVFAGALWLLWRSHADLGRNWSPALEISEGQSLVTGGVFRYIRHPMYAAHILWGIAQVFLLQNWIAGPSMLLTSFLLYMVRAPKEEKMMLGHFGEEYRRYMGRTGGLFPRVGW